MFLLHLLFFYFLLYSFIGWLIEGLFNLCTRGSFSKPNFLYLPLKPMYGITAVLLIRLHQQLSFIPFMICCFIIPIIVEYLTAYLLLHCFNLRYWDYSTEPYQLSGFICLRFFIYWGFLSLLLIYCFQPLIYPFYLSLYPLWFYFFPIFLLIFTIDFLTTLNARQKKTSKSKV